MMRLGGIIFKCTILVLFGILLCWALCARELLQGNRWYMSRQQASEERFANQIDALRRGKGSVGLYDMMHVDEKTRRLVATVESEQLPIETLSIMGGDASNESITQAAAVSGLQELILVDIDADGHGISALAHAPSLERLVMVGTNVDGTGLDALKACSHLRSLTLYQSWPRPIDEGRRQAYMAALRDLKSLEEMQLGGNWLTDSDIQDLRRAMPGVAVTRLAQSPY